MVEPSSGSKGWPRRLNSAALVIFLIVAGFFLFTEHRAHLYGALPYLLLGVCLALPVVVWRLAKRSQIENEVSGSPRPVGKENAR